MIGPILHLCGSQKACHDKCPEAVCVDAKESFLFNIL